jgi:hypothetical protein
MNQNYPNLSGNFNSFNHGEKYARSKSKENPLKKRRNISKYEADFNKMLKTVPFDPQSHNKVSDSRTRHSCV